MIRWFRQLLSRFRQWWRRRRRSHAFAGVAYRDHTADPAPDYTAGKLVIIGPPEMAKWLRFSCPCGCGEILALNLMPNHAPRWSVEPHPDGTLTVFPSVDATTCKSHFWIRRSKIVWVDERQPARA